MYMKYIYVYENSYFYKLHIDDKVETWIKDILSPKRNKISMV